MEDNVTEAKAALVRADKAFNQPSGLSEHMTTETHLQFAQVHATLAVADALDNLVGHLEHRAITVRSE